MREGGGRERWRKGKSKRVRGNDRGGKEKE